MKKTLLVGLMCIVAAFCFCLSACDPSHEHTFDTSKWESDATSHWHKATCGHDVKGDEATHDCDENGKCKICNYDKSQDDPNHEHTFDTSKWESDATSHWHKATCGHDVKGDEATHTFDGAKCTVCDYEHTHDYTGEYEFDEEGHQRKCIICGDLGPVTDHVFDSEVITKEATCTTPGEKKNICECGFEKEETIDATGVHVYETYDGDENNHWLKCDYCDAKKENSEQAHTWNSGELTKAASCGDYGEITYTCTVCHGTKHSDVAPTGQHNYSEDGICSICDDTNGPVASEIVWDSTGFYVTWGWYPQTEEKDAAILTALNDKASKPSDNKIKWSDSGNRIIVDGKKVPYMYYVSVTHNDTRYKGVYFNNYKPASAESTTLPQQATNGYNKDTVYWFKYEPIRWMVVSKVNYTFLVSTVILDAREFYSSSEVRTIDEETIYPNNYEHSDIRAWLNNDFYNSVFDRTARASIVKTTVDNSAASTATAGATYACGNTEDNIFLLSYSQFRDDSSRSLWTYGGYSMDPLQMQFPDVPHKKAPTDWAKMQGSYEYDGGASWMLRSPIMNGDTYTVLGLNYQNIMNTTLFENGVCDTRAGIVPALMANIHSASDYDMDLTGHWQKNKPETKEPHSYDDLGNCEYCGETNGSPKSDWKRTSSNTKKVTMGMYPQSKVTDTALIDTLNGIAGKPDENKMMWTDSGYRIIGNNEPYMWYVGVNENGHKYRGVYFTSYRPEVANQSPKESGSYQENHGYSKGTVYWFEYEPVSWWIISEDEKFLLAEMDYDVHEFNTENGGYSGRHTTESGEEYYDNNYQYSSIRSWLNDYFYYVTFDSSMKSKITNTTLDDVKVTSENVIDKVFLLSNEEGTVGGKYITNYDPYMNKKPTDYAVCQGAQYEKDTYLWWFSRTTADYYERVFRFDGFGGGTSRGNPLNQTFVGVVPAMRLSALPPVSA